MVPREFPFFKAINSLYMLQQVWVLCLTTCVLQLNEPDWYKLPPGLFGSWRHIQKETLLLAILQIKVTQPRRKLEYFPVWNDNGGLKFSVSDNKWFPFTHNSLDVNCFQDVSKESGHYPLGFRNLGEKSLSTVCTEGW